MYYEYPSDRRKLFRVVILLLGRDREDILIGGEIAHQASWAGWQDCCWVGEGGADCWVQGVGAFAGKTCGCMKGGRSVRFCISFQDIPPVEMQHANAKRYAFLDENGYPSP